MKAKQAFIIVLAALLTIIIIQNSGVAVVQLLFWKISMSMIVLIFSVALIGFAIGWLARYHASERNKGE
jgi:uncharacterized integral membrane protein